MPHEVPPISELTLRFFTRIVRSYFRRHFRSVLIQHPDRLSTAHGPLIIYANHTSWWDPMVSILLAQTLLPSRPHYAPMDAAPLARYPILRKLGIFPVEPATARGAVQFLRTSEAILHSGGVVWITPQGRFADPRERPLAFKDGLAALALRVPGVTLLPLAIEYPFWSERLPETLLHFAEPITINPAATTADATTTLEQALEAAMLTLQQASITRAPQAFTPLLEGTRGTGGLYAVGRRLRAFATGKGFQEDHSARDVAAAEATDSKGEAA